MRKVLLLLLTAIVILSAVSFASAAGKKNSFHNIAPQACAPVLLASTFTTTGIVSAVSTPDARNGITVSTPDGDVAFYGLGPTRYWDGLGIDRPQVSDFVQIEAKAVTVNESVINIIVNLAYEDGSSIQLRDPETGCPLWRGISRGTQNGSN